MPQSPYIWWPERDYFDEFEYSHRVITSAVTRVQDFTVMVHEALRSNGEPPNGLTDQEIEAASMPTTMARCNVVDLFWHHRVRIGHAGSPDYHKLAVELSLIHI